MEDNTILKRITTTVLVCDEPLPSGRVYPKSVIKKAITEDPAVIDKLVNKAFLGQFLSGDQDPFCVDMAAVAFNTEKLYFEGNELKADIVILNTARGRILNDLLDANINISFSCVGTGEVSKNKVKNYTLNTIKANIKD